MPTKKKTTTRKTAAKKPAAKKSTAKKATRKAGRPVGRPKGSTTKRRKTTAKKK